MSNDIKPPPNSLEAKQSVVGALRSEHFFLGDHAAIFGPLMRHLVGCRSRDLISLGVALKGNHPKNCSKCLNLQ